MTAPLLDETKAPPSPCTIRKPMIDASFQERAQAAEPAMKIRKPASYIRTLPYMSPSLPTWVARRVMTSR